MTEKHHTDRSGTTRVTLPSASSGGRAQAPVPVRRYAMTRRRRDTWIERNRADTEHLEVCTPVSREREDLQRQIKRKLKVLGLVIAALVGLIIVAILAEVTSSLFVVKKITVTGTERCTAAELSAAAGFGEGTQIKKISLSEAANAILRQYPEFSACTVDADLNGNVEIRVTEHRPVLYFELAGRYYALTENLYVTEGADSAEIFAERGLPAAEISGIFAAVEGKKLEFVSGNGSYISEFMKAAIASDSLPGISRISFADRYSIRTFAVNGSSIRYGSVEDISRKLMIAERVTEENRTVEGPFCIDVSEPDAVWVDYQT